MHRKCQKHKKLKLIKLLKIKSKKTWFLIKKRFSILALQQNLDFLSIVTKLQNYKKKIRQYNNNWERRGDAKCKNEDWIGSGRKYNKYNKYYQEIVCEVSVLVGWLGSLILICSQQSNIQTTQNQFNGHKRKRNCITALF